MKRNPGHRDRLAGRLAARSERDVEQPGCFLGVFEEQLVEVAHAVEEQQVGVLAFERQILLHYRGVSGCVLVCGGHTIIGRGVAET